LLSTPAECAIFGRTCVGTPVKLVRAVVRCPTATTGSQQQVIFVVTFPQESAATAASTARFGAFGWHLSD
jgi:hypothetical protein